MADFRLTVQHVAPNDMLGPFAPDPTGSTVGVDGTVHTPPMATPVDHAASRDSRAVAGAGKAKAPFLPPQQFSLRIHRVNRQGMFF
jgi:hypothetical protein